MVAVKYHDIDNPILRVKNATTSITRGFFLLSKKSIDIGTVEPIHYRDRLVVNLFQ